LGHKDVAGIFESTLKDEKKADEPLTLIEEKNINYEAAEEVQDN
jgi:ferritin-like metal-binding protein YciE